MSVVMASSKATSVRKFVTAYTGLVETNSLHFHTKIISQPTLKSPKWKVVINIISYLFLFGPLLVQSLI